jgi:hypothetical protein
MKYLQETTGLSLELDAESISKTNWQMDISLANHPDTCSHNDGKIIIGTRALYSTIMRNKLTTRGSAKESAKSYECNKFYSIKALISLKTKTG